MRSVRLVPFVLVFALASAACTEPKEPVEPTSPDSPSPSLESPTGGYVYRGPGLEATFELTGERGRLAVFNATGVTVGAPQVYVLDARDGSRIDGETVEAEPIPNGETDRFRVTVPDAPDHRHIGLVLLVLGDVNFGAFVPVEEEG